MPLAFVIVSIVVFAAGCVGWWLVWRSEGFQRYWKSLPRVQQVSLGFVVMPFTLLLPPAGLVYVLYFGPMTLPILVFVGVFLLIAHRAEKRIKREAGEDPVCASCGFPRPIERTEENALCSECGNEWWLEGSLWRPRARRGAVPASTHRVMKSKWQWKWMVVPLLSVLPLFMQRPHHPGWVMSNLPTPVVVWIAESWVGPTRDEALEEVLLQRHAAQSTLDEFWGAILDSRLRDNVLTHAERRLLYSGVGAGRLGPGVLGRHYREACEWGLEVEVDEATRTVIPKLTLIQRAHFPSVAYGLVSPGLRVGEGAWSQPVTAWDVMFSTIAYAYENYTWTEDPDRPEERRDSPDSSDGYQGFEAFSFEGLEPGEHELTVWIHMFAAPVTSIPGPHLFTNPDGTVTPHPDVIWHETRELTATFVVPE